MFPSESEPAFGSFVKEQADDLRKAGVDVDVLPFDGRGARSAYLGAIGRMRDQIRRQRYDIVHAHYGLTGAVAMFQRDVPVVTTFHGSETGYVRWQARVSWVVARKTTPIFVSRKGACALGVPRASIIPIGVDTTHFSPRSREEARLSLGLEPTKTYVLFPGSPKNKRKRHELFRQTLAELKRRGVEVTPIALEGFTREEVPLVMNSVDVTLLTSAFEGSPVAVKESLACLTPVVSTDVGDVAQLLGQLDGCSVREGTPADLASAVEGALQSTRNPEWRKRAAEYARDKIALQVIAVYETVAGA
jgi:glycosyltransferase involved in cell wall biosynthesis